MSELPLNLARTLVCAVERYTVALEEAGVLIPANAAGLHTELKELASRWRAADRDDEARSRAFIRNRLEDWVP